AKSHSSAEIPHVAAARFGMTFHSRVSHMRATSAVLADHDGWVPLPARGFRERAPAAAPLPQAALARFPVSPPPSTDTPVPARWSSCRALADLQNSAVLHPCDQRPLADAPSHRRPDRDPAL